MGRWAPRVLALALPAFATSCSWNVVQKPPPASPTCTESYVPPIIDSAVVVATVVAGVIAHFEIQRTCFEGEYMPGRGCSTASLAYVNLGLIALLFGLSARYGFIHVHECRSSGSLPPRPPLR